MKWTSSRNSYRAPTNAHPALTIHGHAIYMDCGSIVDFVHMWSSSQKGENKSSTSGAEVARRQKTKFSIMPLQTKSQDWRRVHSLTPPSNPDMTCEHTQNHTARCIPHMIKLVIGKMTTTTTCSDCQHAQAMISCPDALNLKDHAQGMAIGQRPWQDALIGTGTSYLGMKWSFTSNLKNSFNLEKPSRTHSRGPCLHDTFLLHPNWHHMFSCFSHTF